MMNIFRKPPAQNLTEWLKIATKKLVSQARQRVWADVTLHYEEAVEGHLQSGSPIEAAQAAALAELGDARVAARRFRRTHLTETEYRKVAGLLKSFQPSLWYTLQVFSAAFGLAWRWVISGCPPLQ